jgi:multicomponent K+:H+ antiporter subunit G
LRLGKRDQIVIVEIVISFFLLVGAGFTLIGSIGLARLPDFYMRLHGPTKATTLGVGSTLIASTLYFTFGRGEPSLHEILVALFLFITAPVSANLMARAALHLRVRSLAEIPAPERAPPRA